MCAPDSDSESRDLIAYAAQVHAYAQEINVEREQISADHDRASALVFHEVATTGVEIRTTRELLQHRR